jgi:hypothetical protein
MWQVQLLRFATCSDLIANLSIPIVAFVTHRERRLIGPINRMVSVWAQRLLPSQFSP